MTLSNLVRATVVALSLSLGAVTIAGPLAGCAAFGVQKPETFNERVVAAYKTVEGAADFAALLYQAGKISKEDGLNVVQQLQTLQEGINVAVSLRAAGDFSSADARLNATIAALTILQSYLASRDGGAK